MASEEEQSTLEQVVGAIRAIYDVRRPNSDRVELNKKIEQFKDNGDPRGVFRIAQLIICSTDYEEVVYHAGWTFLEHLIIFKWVRIDDTLRNDIQTLCFHVLSSERPLRCNMSLKTAISRCFVGIMQHEWPQNTNVFEGLQYIVTSAPEECFGQIEIVYLVVRRLLENVISMVSISNPQRRRDLSITLAAIMPRFLTDTISRLQLCMRSTNAEGAAVIAKAALEATRDIIECGTAKWLADCVESLVDLLCMYLKHPEGSVASLATRCLETLVSRKKSDEEEEIVKVLLRDSSMQAILENASLAIEASKNNPDCYEYLKAICDLLVGLGVKVAHVFETNKEPQNFVLYISAISVFFCHPATYVRGESIGALNHILSNDVLRAREDFVQIMQQRVIPDLKTAFRHSFGLGATAEDNPFDDYDYDDEKEMFNARAKLRHTLVPLLRSIIKDRRFSQQLNEIVRVWMDECRQCDVRTVTTECDALNRVLRIAVTCEDEESKSFYSYLFGSLLKEFESIPKATSMSKQMELTLSFLAALIPTMSVNECPTFLAQMRETFQMKYESKETCVIKRLAIALLIRMVKSMPPESLLQIAEPLLNLVGQSMSLISPLQQGQMLQVTAAISNLIPSIDTRVKFLGDAVGPIITFFTSQEIMKCVESVASFMHHSGFTTQGVLCDPHEADDPFIQNRIQLRCHLTALEGVLAHVQKPDGQTNPLFGHIYPAIPVIFALARCVRSLDSPEAAALLHPSFDRAVFAVSKTEKEQVLISLMETMESSRTQEEEENQQQNPKTNESDWNAQAKSYACQMNLHVQTLMGYFAEKLQKDFFELSNASQMVDSTIEDLHSIPDIRLKSWFRKVWRPIYMHCPNELKPTFAPGFIALQEHVRNLLDARWSALEAVKTNDSASTDEDILAEHVVCMLQREFISVLKDIITENDKLTSWLDLKPLCDSVTSTFLKLMARDDSQSSHKIALMLTRIVKEKYNSSVYGCDEESAVFILRCALEAYHVHGKDSAMEVPLLSLILEIYGGHRTRFYQLHNVLVEATGVCSEVIERFDAKMCSGNSNEKLRRILIRELLQGVVKPPTAALHKNRSELRRQPAVPSKPRIEAEPDVAAVADLFGSG